MFDLGLELDLARNMFGPLDSDTRRRIEAVVAAPSQKTWEDAHCIIVGSDGWMTLWQAVLVIDPTFPRSKPHDAPWPKLPNRDLILSALGYATH